MPEPLLRSFISNRARPPPGVPSGRNRISTALVGRLISSRVLPWASVTVCSRLMPLLNGKYRRLTSWPSTL
ncbi:hypothetical protein D3C73_1544810 [compost metagenome]